MYVTINAGRGGFKTRPYVQDKLLRLVGGGVADLHLHVVDHLDHFTVPQCFEVGLGRRRVLEPAPSEIGAHIGQLRAHLVFRPNVAEVGQYGR